MIQRGMPAALTTLWGFGKAHEILTAAQGHGACTCGVTKFQFLTGNTNCSLMLIHATVQHSDLINRHHTAKPRAK